MENDIRAFKLISGEELIANVIEVTDDFFMVEKPLALITNPGENGQMSIGMIPWSVADPEGTIKLHTRVIAGETSNIMKMLLDGYLQQTTGIMLD